MEVRVLLKNINTLQISEELEREGIWYLEKPRLERIRRMKYREDKLRSLAAGYLLWEMCQTVHADPREYRYEKNGKPYLQGHEDVAFTIAHSGEYAVLAYVLGTNEDRKQRSLKAEHTNDSVSRICSCLRIGMDLQQLRPIAAGLRERILHPKEDRKEDEDAACQNRYLNRVWAIKESFVKMTGQGIAKDFRTIQINFENKQIVTEGDYTAYFRELKAPEGYVMAVCASAEEMLSNPIVICEI